MLEVRINDLDLNQDVKKKIASRALIIRDKKIAILYSKKYNAYITPGGGVEENETLEEACIKDFKIHYIELVSDIDIRLQRNITEKRLTEKSSKRNIKWSRQEILNTNEKHRLVSNDGEI